MALPHAAADRLLRPLPRLRGRDREGAMHQSSRKLSPSPTLPRKRGRECTESAAALFNSRQPSMQIGAHERIVVEVRIGGADAVDLLALSGSQRLLRVETPDA